MQKRVSRFRVAELPHVRREDRAPDADTADLSRHEGQGKVLACVQGVTAALEEDSLPGKTHLRVEIHVHGFKFRMRDEYFPDACLLRQGNQGLALEGREVSGSEDGPRVRDKIKDLGKPRRGTPPVIKDRHTERFRRRVKKGDVQRTASGLSPPQAALSTSPPKTRRPGNISSMALAVR